MNRGFLTTLTAAAVSLLAARSPVSADLERVQYNNPGLTVDLGVGLWAWPLPMDFDGDGDLDLIVSCPDVPYRGTYLFENPGGNAKMPVFRWPVRVGSIGGSVRVTYVDGRPRVLSPGKEWVDFLGKEFKATRRIYPDTSIGTSLGRVRFNLWHFVDFDGDGALDLLVGVDDWGDYGWADAYNSKGEWTRGPQHGYVYVVRNRGTTARCDYDKPLKLAAGGKPIDVYGLPCPNLADFDGDGDLDLICGEFLDGFTWFENVGTRKGPRYAAGRRLTHGGKPLTMDLQMITPTAVDWDRDGDVDLVVGDEDGRVALVENAGRAADGMVRFLPPRYFQQEAGDLKFGALVTPVSVDFDGDGDEDLLCGNTAGYIGFIENLDGGNPPKGAAPVRLEADGRTIRIQAGRNGSIQGPCEAKWGYTTLSVADWDHDGLADLVVNSIWGKVVWYRNTGTKREPKLAAARPIEVRWEGKPPKPSWTWWEPQGSELATQWRTTPVVVDWDRDGLNDLVMLDHEGYLALFQRRRLGGRLVLLPGERIFHDGGGPLRLNGRSAGGSGRRKLCIVDFDGDGRLDILVNSTNADFLRNTGVRDGKVTFQTTGALGGRKLAGHTTSPTTVDWDGDGRRELLVGAEDGCFYHLAGSAGTSGKIERGGLTVEGRRFERATLDNDGRAFTNRKYTWFDVPQKLRGWTYTRTSGGVSATIAVTARRDATVHIATAPSQKGIELSGWEKVEGLAFGYTDKGRTRMHVYRRAVKAGQRLAIPQGNWTGGLVLLPAGE
ncbi:MAG: VCBS repeat-containing protein [Phycisphaerae bacterium]